MPVSSSKRFQHSNGAVVVALALDATPFVAVYKFTYEDGWGTRYADPSVVPTFGTNATMAAWSPDHDKLYLTGITGNVFHTYPWTDKDGYGTGTTETITTPSALRTVTFSEVGDRMMLAGENAVNEFAYSGGKGASQYSVGIGGLVGRGARFIHNDEYLIQAFSGFGSIVVRRRNASGAPTLTDPGTAFVPDPFNYVLGNVLADGTRPLAVPSPTGLDIFRFNTTTGIVGAAITPPTTSTVQFATFDPYGRLIIAETNTPFLNVYTMDSAGTFTLVDSFSSFAGGVVRSMVYDDRSDILFVGSEGTPYITAIKMSGAGFVSAYSNPSTSVGTDVIHASIKFDKNWTPST